MADSLDNYVAPGTLPVFVEQLLNLWLSVRGPLVAPVLQFAINVCLVMVTMLFVERIFMCGVMVFIKLLRRTPESVYKFEPLRDDLEFGNSSYHMVLVKISSLAPSSNLVTVHISGIQFLSIPPHIMTCPLWYQVYQLSIQAACGLSWPADRVIIQVLDDSTDPTTKVPHDLSSFSMLRFPGSWPGGPLI
jgi:beta-mannan synthase